MKFQFSIARLLMATAMVAFTFGLCRMMLEEEITESLTLVTILAVDMGLIALVARKRTDLYRILRTIFFVFSCVPIVAAVYLFFQRQPFYIEPYVILMLVAVPMIFFVIFFGRVIAKETEEEKSTSGATVETK